MLLRSRSSLLRGLRAFLITLLLTGGLALGQTSDTSLGDVGLSILQGLSPEQRSAISEQLGGLGGGLGLGGTSGNRPRGTNLEELSPESRRDQQRDFATARAESERLSPFLQAEDWIVITIDSKPLPVLPVAPLISPLTPGLPSTATLGPYGTYGGFPATPGAAGVTNPAAAAAAGTLPNTAVPGGAAAAAAGANQTVNVTAGGYAPPPPPRPLGQLGQTPGQQATTEDTDQPRQELTDEEKKVRAALIDLIRSRNPYQLSRDGVLTLPGFAPIPLAGLTEQLATLRLGAEPSLRNLFIRVTKLPLKKVGPTALKPFGYDLFDHDVSTFAPATNVPVPSDYVLGPDDELEVQLYGNQNRSVRLKVGRDGIVNFPQLGPINVSGETFRSAKADLESRVERQMIGVHANVSMSDTRSIRVFVLGDAKDPGSYTISGLGTITSALFAAGGVRPIGSLRNILLKRRGAVIRRLDLYDMLIRGDTTDDTKLLAGDVIFVPPIGATVTVDGEVHRPAIYEIRNETSLGDVVQLAGGLTPEADTAKAALTRIDSAKRRVVLQMDLGGSGRSQPVRNGDVLRVSRLRPTIDAGVVLQGYVYTTGAFAYRAGMRLTDVIRSVDDLKPNADLHYVLIRRELPPDRQVTVLSADLAAALNAPGTAADVPLMARDTVTVFDLQSSRDRIIHPLLLDLKLQSTINRPEGVVQIDGRANVPGEYPLEQQMTVRDLIRAGGGLSDGAYEGTAELTRYTVVNGDTRRAELLKVDLGAAMRGDPNANIALRPFDRLSVKEVQAWTAQQEVTLRGEVKFPGKYAIRRGETLKSVLLRAGGLTEFAFPQGSVFIRKSLREQEQKQLDLLAVRMQNDIAFVALQGAAANQSGAATALTVGQSLIAQLRETRAVGRLVINLPAIVNSPVGSSYDVVLDDTDELLVPKFQQQVTVIGEVATTTSHLYRPGLTRNDYIALSGGETPRADSGRIYIVRADGGVVASAGSRWFKSGSGNEVRPGDTIVVPLNAEHLPPLPLWQAVTQILYNLSIAVLAIHSVT
jgi:protein involved in polysaccharide export with SLBB domain